MHDLLMSFSKWLQELGWVTALEDLPRLAIAVEVIHYFSLFLIVGTIAAVDLRLLDLGGRRQTATQLAEQLFPWTWIGLGLSILSGFLLYAPDAAAFAPSNAYWWKLTFILPGVVLVRIIQQNVSRWESAPAIPLTAKLSAFFSLVIWISIILLAVEVANQAAV
jgi:uncharacterized membrane protein YbaN (DUF454 family)